MSLCASEEGIGDDAQLTLPFPSLAYGKLGTVMEENGDMVNPTHRTKVGAPTLRLYQQLIHSLSPYASPRTATMRSRPLELVGKSPLPSLIRVYAYTMTAPESERQVGAWRIQVTGLAAERTPAHFDWSDGAFVVLAGFDESLKVFALWDAGIYDGPQGVAWSRNCQVLDRTLYQALTEGVAEQTRHLRSHTQETVVAASSKHLVEGLSLRWTRTVQRLLQSEPATP